jgi:hypothetical protein
MTIVPTCFRRWKSRFFLFLWIAEDVHSGHRQPNWISFQSYMPMGAPGGVDKGAGSVIFDGSF